MLLMCLSQEVAGMGGTSYAAVEYYRAQSMRMHMKECMGKLFWDWGISTAVALRMASKHTKIPIVSYGGLRTGIDIAKSIAIGASLTAVAWPLLRLATVSADSVRQKLDELIYGLKTVMNLFKNHVCSSHSFSSPVITYLSDLSSSMFLQPVRLLFQINCFSITTISNDDSLL